MVSQAPPCRFTLLNKYISNNKKTFQFNNHCIKSLINSSQLGNLLVCELCELSLLFLVSSVFSYHWNATKAFRTFLDRNGIHRNDRTTIKWEDSCHQGRRRSYSITLLNKICYIHGYLVQKMLIAIIGSGKRVETAQMTNHDLFRK